MDNNQGNELIRNIDNLNLDDLDLSGIDEVKDLQLDDSAVKILSLNEKELFNNFSLNDLHLDSNLKFDAEDNINSNRTIVEFNNTNNDFSFDSLHGKHNNNTNNIFTRTNTSESFPLGKLNSSQKKNK